MDLDEVREILGDVVREGHRASEVIRRMRGLVRKGEIESVPLDIADLMREVAELLHSDIIMRGMRIVLEIASALPAVRGDRVQLQQVMLNLLLNAFDAMKDSPPGLRVTVVRVTPDGYAALRVAVSDSGCGLAGDLPERVFTPFYTTKSEGLGLGLPICRNIIEAHGGNLRGENNAQGGATFYFTLPVDTAQAALQT
jgi:two-component system sensor kinase FixL